MSEASFTHRILVQPLGLLYGSKGRFLSPENLVGRSGYHFPPDTPTLSGLYAYRYQDEPDRLQHLMLAGPFWAYRHQPENFYVPTPFHCWVAEGNITHIFHWVGDSWQVYPDTSNQSDEPSPKSREFNTWISLNTWLKVRSISSFEEARQSDQPIPAVSGPWESVPQLHPRLREQERRSVGATDPRGSLFLEFGIQLDPKACLVYLSNTAIDGCYRFGGEGHMVSITSEPIDPNESIHTLLSSPLNKSFGLVCPGVWGSNRLSYRAPFRDKDTGDLSWPDNPVQALLTQRPKPFRFRMGNQKNKDNEDDHHPEQPKLLSRGRYAVPAGSVYVLEDQLDPWLEWEPKQPWKSPEEIQWPEHSWFPTEGYSFKRWGCALAFPLELST